MKVDIFQVVSDPLSDGPKGYGLVESIDFIPALHSYYFKADENRVFHITHILQSKERTIALCIEKDFSVQHIFTIPGAFDGPDVCYPSCPPPPVEL